ncbi:hypothetical protein [Ramlibacter sp.]|uniref:hypothetical protein n=1 Tax=Ramlibacter sp. TaxID=1917967 RepID=UPI003D13EE04
MSKNAFIMLRADRLEHSPVKQVAGAVQQETRLYEEGRCIAVLLVTFPPGSPEYERWSAGRTLDGMTAPRADSIESDAAPAHT